MPPKRTPSTKTADKTTLLPTIKQWTSHNEDKISSFLLYADWRNWARFDLFSHLKTHGFDVQHSYPLWGDKEDDPPVVDLVAGKGKIKQTPVWICAQRANENDTSFGDFVEKFKREWEEVKRLTQEREVDDVEGGRLLFLGLGEKFLDEEDREFGGLKPAAVPFGGNEEGLYVYYLWLDLPK